LITPPSSPKQWRRNEFESGGHRFGAKVGGHKSAGKNFLVVPLHFLALKAQLVVLVCTFVMVSTVWSISCLLFFYSRCPCAQPFVKLGTRANRAPWSRRHCLKRDERHAVGSVAFLQRCVSSVARFFFGRKIANNTRNAAQNRVAQRSNAPTSHTSSGPKRPSFPEIARAHLWSPASLETAA